ncbi:class I SAM-dependent methyltransferase, partial [Herbaspirillum sp. RTI4]|uniref:class I SAM-dependent methyltransferase n=1 Tax=Herbaspirillum sp. RTI4 TaxID=3048640 RepID=UPI002B239537
AKRGYVVTAVEPSGTLMRLAKRTHNQYKIHWINDSLPSLSKVRRLDEKYEFILLSAVWMHVSPDDRQQALFSLCSILSRTGHVALTIRFGPASKDRMMYPVEIDELIKQAEKAGLFLIYNGRRTFDSMSRLDVYWKKLVFIKK